MARATWLPSVLRGAGLQVVEWSGWASRGSDTFNPVGIIAHATAGSRTATDQAEINVLLTGSSSAPPPIAQLYLSRTGTWYVIASGRCNHALTGWGGPLKGYGNSNLIGIEAANDNRGETWGSAQYDSYVRGVAAILKYRGWNPYNHLAGHKEHQPYPPPAGQSSTKSDPTFGMGDFRARVAAHISGGGEDLDTEQNRKLHNLDAWLSSVLTGRDSVEVLNPDGTKSTYPIDFVKDINNLRTEVAEIRASQGAGSGGAGTVALTAEQMAELRAGIVADLAAAGMLTEAQVEEAAFRASQRAENI